MKLSNINFYVTVLLSLRFKRDRLLFYLKFNINRTHNFILNTVFEWKNRLPNRHLSLFQKSYVKPKTLVRDCRSRFMDYASLIAFTVSGANYRLELKKNQFAVKCWCMSIAPRSAVWSRNFFYHGGEKDAIALAPPASRQVENRSSAIYRDCQRAFEQSSVPSASDSFCRIFQKFRKVGPDYTRDL